MNNDDQPLLNKKAERYGKAIAGFVAASGSASEPTYQQKLDAWKAKQGLTDTDTSNPEEMRMLAEQKLSTEKSWCLGCDAHLPVKDMVLITRRLDPYVQIDEGPTDYISKANRIYKCPACYKADEDED